MRSRDNVSAAGFGAAVIVFSLASPAPSQAAALQEGPAVVDVGPVALTPTIGVETRYRDNIYLQERDTVDSWIYLARPGLNARVQDRDNIYQLEYQGEAAWYQESSSDDKNDYMDHTFSGDAHVELSERWIVEGFASWAALHEDRGTGLSEGFVGEFIPEPIEYDQADVGGTVQFGLGEDVGRVLFNAAYMDRDYQNFPDLTKNRDREETVLSTTLFLPVAPKTDALLEYAFKDVAYPNPFEELAQLDSTENALWLGAHWEITPNFTSIAKLGYVDKDFDADGREDWNGLGIDVSLWMQPREHDTLLVEASRVPEETSLQGDFILRDSLLVEWTHDWSDRVFTRLSATIDRDTYEQSVDDREDDIYNAAFEVGYEFRRWTTVTVGYAYDDKDSNSEGLSYTDHIFHIALELSL